MSYRPVDCRLQWAVGSWAVNIVVVREPSVSSWSIQMIISSVLHHLACAPYTKALFLPWAISWLVRSTDCVYPTLVMSCLVTYIDRLCVSCIRHQLASNIWKKVDVFVGSYLVNTIVIFLHTSVNSLPTIPKWTDNFKQYTLISRNVYHPVTNAYLRRTVGKVEPSNTADRFHQLTRYRIASN
jgi:hypothetical protein